MLSTFLDEARIFSRKLKSGVGDANSIKGATSFIATESMQVSVCRNLLVNVALPFPTKLKKSLVDNLYHVYINVMTKQLRSINQMEISFLTLFSQVSQSHRLNEKHFCLQTQSVLGHSLSSKKNSKVIIQLSYYLKFYSFHF